MQFRSAHHFINPTITTITTPCLKSVNREVLGGPVVRTRCFHSQGWGSLPRQGTKICKPRSVAKNKVSVTKSRQSKRNILFTLKLYWDLTAQNIRELARAPAHISLKVGCQSNHLHAYKCKSLTEQCSKLRKSELNYIHLF